MSGEEGRASAERFALGLVNPMSAFTEAVLMIALPGFMRLTAALAK
jgi:hypothetical protein